MTAETETVTAIELKGLVDAADRILRELIRTPKFKEGVMVLLNSIDPPAARRLVRTFMWGDPGLLMSIMGSLPQMINTASEAVAELAAQMNTMPPLLLQDFLNRVFAGIDGAAAGEAAGGLARMALSLNLSDKEGGLARSLSALGSDFGRAYAEAAGEGALTARLEAWVAGLAERAADKTSNTHAFIQAAGKAIAANPAFTENVLRPLLSPALAEAKKPAAKKAAKPKAGEEK
ncbi:MAG: hypothetical protein AB1384_13925 [Actinomycetota bacterium]